MAERAGKAITARAVVVGLTGAGLLSAVAVLNDNYLRQTLAVGNHLPAIAFVFLLIVAFGWNALAARRWPGAALRTGEMAVVLAMFFAACFPPTSGLFRFFLRQLILPFYYLRDKPDWQTYGVLDYLPGKLFPLGGRMDQDVYMGFVHGMAHGRHTVPLADLPLRAWWPPLLYWAPLIALMSACGIGLSLLVHRQWAHHEQLSYPLATVATAFVRRTEGRRLPDVFRARLFWLGAAFVLGIYVFKYLAAWFPGTVPDIGTQWNIIGALSTKFPVLRQVPVYGWGSQTLFYSILGITYFLSSEIGLTMGLNNLILTFAAAQMYVSTGRVYTGAEMEVFRGGAYIGCAAILAYTGRHYYAAVFRRALGFGRPAEGERESVLGARLLLAAFAGFVGVLIAMGLDALVAVCFALLLLLLFLVFTRIICETGIPFMQASWMPGTLLGNIFGAAALGPGPMVMVYFIGTILVQDPRECLMPYVATGMKVADDANVSRSGLVRPIFGAILVSFAVAFVASSWISYNFGAITADNYSATHVPQAALDNAARSISRLTETGDLEAARAASGVGKLRLIAFDRRLVAGLVLGAGAFVALSLLRFRFSRCPIHPVLLLVWGTYPANTTWWSFLLGWTIKELVVRFGGGRVYQNLKPLFIGLIAGELMAAGLSVAIGLVYYAVTGNVPPITFHVLPV